MITIKKTLVTIIYKFLVVLIYYKTIKPFLFLQCIMMYILNLENAIKNDDGRSYKI